MPLSFSLVEEQGELILGQIPPSFTSLSREAAVSPFVLMSRVWDDVHSCGSVGGADSQTPPSLPLFRSRVETHAGTTHGAVVLVAATRVTRRSLINLCSLTPTPGHKWDFHCTTPSTSKVDSLPGTTPKVDTACSKARRNNMFLYHATVVKNL